MEGEYDEGAYGGVETSGDNDFEPNPCYALELQCEMNDKFLKQQDKMLRKTQKDLDAYYKKEYKAAAKPEKAEKAKPAKKDKPEKEEKVWRWEDGHIICNSKALNAQKERERKEAEEKKMAAQRAAQKRQQAQQARNMEYMRLQNQMAMQQHMMAQQQQMNMMNFGGGFW